MSNQWLRPSVIVTSARLIALAILVTGIAPLSVDAQMYDLNNIKIQLLSGEVLKGRLKRLSVDSLYIETKSGMRKTAHYRSVDHVKMHRKGGVDNGILIGAGAGTAIGVMLAVAAQDDGSGTSSSSGGCYLCNINPIDPVLEVIGAGLLGALAGATVGAVFSSQPKKIDIQGDRKNYEDLRTLCLLSLTRQAEKSRKSKKSARV